LLQNKAFRLFCKRSNIPRASLQACVGGGGGRARQRGGGHRARFDAATSTRGFVQMSAPRKGSLSLSLSLPQAGDGDAEARGAGGRVCRPRSIQRLFEGKRVSAHGSPSPLREGRSPDPDPRAREATHTQHAQHTQPGSGSGGEGRGVKVQDFAFNSLRRSHRPKHAGRAGSVSVSVTGAGAGPGAGGGIAFSLRQFDSPSSSPIDGTSPACNASSLPEGGGGSGGGGSPARRTSRASSDLPSPMPRPVTEQRSRRSSSVTDTSRSGIADGGRKGTEDKPKVSWGKAYAAAAALASSSGSGDYPAPAPSAAARTLPRCMSGGSLAGTAAAPGVDWRFPRPRDSGAPPALESRGLDVRGKEARGGGGGGGGGRPQQGRTVTSDAVGVSGRDKVQPLFSDKEMDKM
jgi:hypothetical protein